MKTAILVLGLLGLTATTLALIPPANAPAEVVPAVPIPVTLTQDFEELLLFVPTRMIMNLMTRYLFNDAEFQAVVRTVNSYDAFILRMRIRSQPEVIMFQSWVRSQLLLSGGSLELELESAEVGMFSTSPYWANSVYGWQGFLAEFLSYYPQELIRAHINIKIAQNGNFAQFWARLKALKPVYERVLAFPETKRIITQLQTAGVDTNQLDQLIRTQFDWLNPPVVPAAPVAPAAPTVSTAGQAAPSAQPAPPAQSAPAAPVAA